MKTTKSGLGYKIITPGTGIKPGSNDFVNVHYKGSFIKGGEFDSSYGIGQPITISIQKVIKGWKEGLQLMPEGSTYMFYIPGEPAYGKKGMGIIPGNQPSKTS